MKKNLSSISGVTLIEILIGIVISVIMMAAMFTSYNAVNNTYSQVIDRAKISQTGRDVVGMLVRDIRLAGFKHFEDTSKPPHLYLPIKIYKKKKIAACDKIELMYGDKKVIVGSKPIKFEFVTYKITYECKESQIIDKKTKKKIDAYGIYKSKEKWTGTKWEAPTQSTDDFVFKDELIVDHVQDMIFLAIDKDGKIIDPPPLSLNASSKITVVDILLSFRSQKEFYRNKEERESFSLGKNTNKKFTDKFLRESIVVSAHTRNIGLE